MADNTLDRDANGTGIDMATGETVVVALDEDPQSVYHWEPDTELQDNIMKLENMEVEENDDTRTRRFTYSATQPGTGTINLQLWDEMKREVTAHYNVAVQVRG